MRVLRPAEDQLDHEERMFDLRTDFRLGAVATALLLTQRPMAMRLRLYKTLDVGSMALQTFDVARQVIHYWVHC